MIVTYKYPNPTQYNQRVCLSISGLYDSVESHIANYQPPSEVHIVTDLIYCPVCCRDIEPECDEFGDEIEMPEGGRMYVHDDVPHDHDYQFEELQ